MSKIERNRYTSCHSIREKALDLDQFGSGFNFKLPDGRDTINTMVGFTTSLVVLLILLMYSSMQMHRLSLYGENLVTTSAKDSHYDQDYVISTQKNGIKFAFALTAYDNNVTWVDESEYGTVGAMYHQWGLDGEAVNKTKIVSRPCTLEELGVGGNEPTAFHPVHKKSRSSLEKYHDKFMCVDENI